MLIKFYLWFYLECNGVLKKANLLHRLIESDIMRVSVRTGESNSTAVAWWVDVQAFSIRNRT